MILNAEKLDAVLKKPLDAPVYYFFSTEEYLVRQAARRAVETLCRQEGEDATVLPGPTPGVEEMVLAAGTISLFGTRRVVEMPLVQPSAYSDKDLAALCDLLQSAENAVFVLTSVFADEKAMGGKRAKALISAAEKLGVAAQLNQPGPGQITAMLTKRAAELGTKLPKEAAQALLDRCGQDLFLLQNEVDKLAAAGGYTEITPELVSRLAARSIEADVFEMVRLVQAGRTAQAFGKLEELLLLQNEPVAIAAALAGSYVDMYRVKTGQQAGHGYGQVHRDFGYKGSDWRLKKSGEAAARMNRTQLENALEILMELDKALKSSPADKTVLLQTALARLIAAGARR